MLSSAYGVFCRAALSLFLRMWSMDLDACSGCFEKTKAKWAFASFAPSMTRAPVPDTQSAFLDIAASFDVRILMA